MASEQTTEKDRDSDVVCRKEPVIFQENQVRQYDEARVGLPSDNEHKIVWLCDQGLHDEADERKFCQKWQRRETVAFDNFKTHREGE